jgi:hypothetical protein
VALRAASTTSCAPTDHKHPRAVAHDPDAVWRLAADLRGDPVCTGWAGRTVPGEARVQGGDWPRAAWFTGARRGPLEQIKALYGFDEPARVA